MAARHWMAEAFGKHPGALTRQARAAGEGTMTFAREHAHSSGTTGKRARLALIGKEYGSHRKHSVREAFRSAMK